MLQKFREQYNLFTIFPFIVNRFKVYSIRKCKFISSYKFAGFHIGGFKLHHSWLYLQSCKASEHIKPHSVKIIFITLIVKDNSSCLLSLFTVTVMRLPIVLLSPFVYAYS